MLYGSPDPANPDYPMLRSVNLANPDSYVWFARAYQVSMYDYDGVSPPTGNRHRYWDLSTTIAVPYDVYD